MRCKTNFEATAGLTDQFPLIVIEVMPDKSKRLSRIHDELVIASTPPDSSAAQPDIRSKTRTADWKTECQCPEDATHGMTHLIARYLTREKPLSMTSWVFALTTKPCRPNPKYRRT